MNIELTDKELQIIKKALKELIDKDGISEAQEIYLHNIDNGMSQEDADKQFQLDNKKDWDYMINEKKDLLYCLFYKLFIKE
mgnify:FL=1